MAKIDTLKIKMKPTGVEETIKKLQILKSSLIELQKLGLKKKTLNLIVGDLLKGSDKDV